MSSEISPGVAFPSRFVEIRGTKFHEVVASAVSSPGGPRGRDRF